MKKSKWNIKPTKVTPIKIIPVLNKKFDMDKDGVPDWKDCKPFNPKRQHISRTTRERLENLDIEVRDERGGPRDYYHVTSKEASRYAPKAVQQVKSVVKRYPNIVGRMERLDEEKPILWRHTSEEDPNVWELGHFGVLPGAPNYFINTRSFPVEVLEGGKRHKDMYRRSSLAKTVLHEQSHAEDQLSLSPERYEGVKVEYKNMPQLSEEEWEEKYWEDAIGERKARVDADEEIIKRWRRRKLEGEDIEKLFDD